MIFVGMLIGVVIGYVLCCLMTVAGNDDERRDHE